MDTVNIIDMSLLIIAHVFVLRAIDSFKSSPRRASHNPDRSPLGINTWWLEDSSRDETDGSMIFIAPIWCEPR